jgi:hypothetical protein
MSASAPRWNLSATRRAPAWRLSLGTRGSEGSEFWAARRAQLRPSPACQQDVNSWRTPEFNPPADSQEAPVVASPAAASAPAPEKSPPSQGKKKTFEQRYRELTLFYMEHGHCVVPINCPSGLEQKAQAWLGAACFACAAFKPRYPEAGRRPGSRTRGVRSYSKKPF